MTCVSHPRRWPALPPLSFAPDYWAGTPLMDAAREGHEDIASMLREAGASDVTLAAESAPLHKVQNDRPLVPAFTLAHSYSHPVAGRRVCQGCWGRLRQRGVDVAAAQPAQVMNTTALFEAASQWPRERQFGVHILYYLFHKNTSFHLF
jgi:hypothetical protein